MRSCPKCGSIKIKFLGKGKRARCENSQCGFTGLAVHFRGLSGTKDYQEPNQESIVSQIRTGHQHSGLHAKPVRYDDDDDDFN